MADCAIRLRPFRKTIWDATEFYVTHLEAEATKERSLLLRDCAAEFIAARQRDFDRGELAKRSWFEIKQRMRHLVAAIGDRRISECDAERDSAPFSSKSAQIRTLPQPCDALHGRKDGHAPPPHSRMKGKRGRRSSTWTLHKASSKSWRKDYF